MLRGRDAERASLVALVDGARAARAGALVLRGEPGVGKTALLDDLVAGVQGVRVLRTQGLESEAPLAFAALYRLLRPLLALRDRIPVPQARALAVAFGQEDGERVDPFLVAVATLSLLTEAGEQLPVLVVVDDAHWLDPASADALLFTARRLQADRVALLFSVRDEVATPFRPDGVPVLAITPLDEASARSLFEDSAGAMVADDVADRLLAQSAGNPLALVELATTLTAAQLAGEASIPSHLPLTADMERVFLDRARRLPDQVQSLLLIAAADDSGRIRTVGRAAAILGIDGAAISAAETSGLLVQEGDTLRVRHPLVRSAIYQAATGLDRRQVHQALAEALDGEGEPDRQAWHLAAAATGPDVALAATLESTAARSEQRGGYGAASEAFERAAELTAEADKRAARHFAAARNAWDAGAAARAAALAGAARQETDDPVLRADIDRLRGRIEVNIGSAAAAHRIYATAAAALGDRAPERALDLAVAAAGLAAYGGDSGTPLDPGAIATDPAPGDPVRVRSLTQLLLAMTAAHQGRWTEAVERFAGAVEAGVQDTHPDDLAHLGQAALHLGDDAAALRCFSTMLGGARERGAGMAVLYALPRLAFPLFLSGHWSAARSASDEARALARSSGHPALTGAPLASLALISALRGEDALGELLVELDALMEGTPLGILSGPTHDLRRWALGVRAASTGAVREAHHQLSQVTTPALVRMAAIDRIDAAVRAGDTPQATLWVEELIPFAEATGWEWALGAADVGRALVGAPARAAELFESAVAHYDQADRPYDLARTELAFGEHLRRSQQRVDARAHLRRALEVFEELRAEPFIARAAHELRASGETARKRDVTTLVRLTPMELQVAQLVSQGLSNKEVAAQCWVSPRTVAFHLRNCFAKTGVTSRGELAQLDLT